MVVQRRQNDVDKTETYKILEETLLNLFNFYADKTSVIRAMPVGHEPECC